MSQYSKVLVIFELHRNSAQKMHYIFRSKWKAVPLVG